MISGANPQLLAGQAADTRDIVRFKQEMDGLKQRLSGNAGNKEKQLRKACQDFEAIFISKLWKGMKSTVPKEGYLHSRQEEQYMSMFDREFAEKMARAGGIGLADMIYDQLSQKLKETSRATLVGGAQIKPVEPQPIELASRGAIPLQEKQAMTLEDWGGSKSEGDEVDSGEIMSIDMAVDNETSDRPMTDMDVKAQIETLARRLEADRIKAELLDTASSARKQGDDRGSREQIGRIFAKNG